MRVAFDLLSLCGRIITGVVCAIGGTYCAVQYFRGVPVEPSWMWGAWAYWAAFLCSLDSTIAMLSARERRDRS